MTISVSTKNTSVTILHGPQADRAQLIAEMMVTPPPQCQWRRTDRRGQTWAGGAEQFTPAAATYLLPLHKNSGRSPGRPLVKDAAPGTGLASRIRPELTDPCRRRPPSLSLTSGALRPLSPQHLISPLNLRLTRSFSSKGLPLCLQPSSTNGAWRGIEGRWRLAAVSAVARWKNQPGGAGRKGAGWGQ